MSVADPSNGKGVFPNRPACDTERAARCVLRAAMDFSALNYGLLAHFMDFELVGSTACPLIRWTPCSALLPVGAAIALESYSLDPCHSTADSSDFE
jgi:hypothetical protein